MYNNTKSNIIIYFFIVLVGLIIIILQYHLWFSSTSLIEYNSLKKYVKIQAEEISAKSKINIQIYSEIVLLRKNSETLESLVRNKMGFIKKGEIFYNVK